VLAKYDDSTEEQRKLRAGDVYNFHSYPALFVFDQGKHHRYTGGLEPDDIVSYMTAVSKGQSIAIEQQAARGLFESLPNYNEDILTELSENMIETTPSQQNSMNLFLPAYLSHTTPRLSLREQHVFLIVFTYCPSYELEPTQHCRYRLSSCQHKIRAHMRPTRF